MNTEQLKLEDGESIIRTVRKHWFILFTQTIGLALAGIAPLILASIIIPNTQLLPNITVDITLWYRPLVFFGTAWILVIWMMLAAVWTDYYLDMWIITTRRVIAVDQKGFFNRSVASFRLERLQDITVDINGLIPTLLDFGTINADTASHSDVFVIRGAPHPRDIKALIQEHADEVIGHTTARDI